MLETPPPPPLKQRMELVVWLKLTEIVQNKGYSSFKEALFWLLLAVYKGQCKEPLLYTFRSLRRKKIQSLLTVQDG